MKKYVRKTTKSIAIFLEVFIAFLFFYATIAMYGAIIPTGEVKTKGDLYIYVQSNGIHTDVCLPTFSEGVNWLTFLPKEDYTNNLEFDFPLVSASVDWDNLSIELCIDWLLAETCVDI